MIVKLRKGKPCLSQGTVNCMKKVFPKLLVLLLTFSLLLSGASVFAATVTFVAEEKVVETVTPTDGSVTMPDAPLVKNGMFVGWYGTLNGKKFLLPAGAELADVNKNLTVTAATVYYVTDAKGTLRIKDDDLGLRFTSTISTADYERLVSYAGEKNVSVGTYIIPKFYLTYVDGKFDLDVLAKRGYEKYLEIPAETFYSVDKKAGTSVVAGSVCKVLEENRSLDLGGCGYLKLTYTNGESARFYAEFNQSNNVFNLACVAREAYNDRNEKYPNLIRTEYGSYESHSMYTEKELHTIQAMLDSVVFVSYRIEKDPVTGSYTYFNHMGTHYKSPWIVTVSDYEELGMIATVSVAPSEGHSIDELKGVVFGSINTKSGRYEGRYLSMTALEAGFVNGTFRFKNEEGISVVIPPR